MPRLIDANALIAEMHNVILEDGEDRSTFYEVIERQPTIEQPEIVRCRKCKHWIDNDGFNHDKGAECEVMRMWMQPGDYCSYSKKREVEDGNTN